MTKRKGFLGGKKKNRSSKGHHHLNHRSAYRLQIHITKFAVGVNFDKYDPCFSNGIMAARPGAAVQKRPQNRKLLK